MENSTTSEHQKEEEEDINSSGSEEWQELCKSDYAKVIFTELYYHIESGVIGCKFQITDEVHEDPCDYVGLFRVGYEDLSQCIASKMLSQTTCEDDGKLLQCIFNVCDLPTLEEGFYQFLYVTCGRQEVAGASVPIQVKSTELVAEEEGDFMMVKTALEKQKELQHQDALTKLETELSNAMKEWHLARDKCIENKMDLERMHMLLEQNEILLEQKNTELMLMKIDLEGLKMHLKQTNTDLEKQVMEYQASAQRFKDELTEAREFNQKILKQRESEVRQVESKYEKMSTMFKQKCDELQSERHEHFMKEAEVKELKKKLQDQCLYLQAGSDHQKAVYQQCQTRMEDQKCMIKALEHSKQMALKEITSLSNKLILRTEALSTAEEECGNLKLELGKAKDILQMQVDDYTNVTKQLEETTDKLQKQTCAFNHLELSNNICKKRIEDAKDLLGKQALSHTSAQRECAKAQDEAKQHLQKIAELTEDLNEKAQVIQHVQSELEEKKIKEITELHEQALQAELVKQKIIKMEEESNEKDQLIQHLQSELEKEKANTETQLGEMVERLEQASEIYKQQYICIQKLTKKAKLSSRKSSQSSVPSSHNKPCVFDWPPLISDSDTGEHTSCPNTVLQQGQTEMDPSMIESVAMTTSTNYIAFPQESEEPDVDCAPVVVQSVAEVMDDCITIVFDSSHEQNSESETLVATNYDDIPDLEEVEILDDCCAELFLDNLKTVSDETKVVVDGTSSNPHEKTVPDIEFTNRNESTPCPLCPEQFVCLPSGMPVISFFDHMEDEHHLKMCPFCGHLFHSAVPDKYLFNHIEINHKETNN